MEHKNLKNKKIKRLEKKTFNKFKSKNKKKNITEEYIGTVDHVSKDFAFIIIEGRKKDIKVYKRNLLGSFHKDVVKINISKNKEPYISEIVKRNKSSFVGKIINKTFFYKYLKKDTLKKIDKNINNLVQLDGKRYYDFVIINSKNDLKAKNDDKVIVEMLNWPKKNKLATAKVIKILGKSGDHAPEMDSILFEYHLPTSFPKKIQNECKKINENIGKKEISERRDFRNTICFTIDPENAKDYDDALTIKYLDNGNYEIGIHVADVGYYVPENSLLDKEARKRGNSVYLVDRTIPMIPEILSNKICSLQQNEEKLTFSVVFEMNGRGQIISKWIGKSIIQSDKAFVYEEAFNNIKNQSGDFYKELTLLNEIAKKIRINRFATSSLNFISPEYYIKLDEEGNPINILKKKIIDTHNIIEEFMLLANIEIANFYLESKKKSQFIFRIHDRPSEDKLLELKDFLKIFKYQFNFQSKNLFKEFNKLFEFFKNKSEFSIIQNISIRSMSKAIYSTKNLSHFGLGFRNYTHFTSPIRRYADLLVHREIENILKKEKIKNKLDYKEISKHISKTERNGIDAERASIKYKQTVYLSAMKNKILKGIICHISEKSLFIELVNSGCEGFIPFSEIKDDYYIFDRAKFKIVGRNNKKEFKIGQSILVKVVSCDLDKKITKFSIV